MEIIKFAAFFCLSLLTGICSLPLPVQGANPQEQTLTGNDSLASLSQAVTGTVTYRQRIALPPEAILEVKLLDVSLQDVAAKVISQQTIATRGKQVPIPFKLMFDPAKIKPNHSYAVRAEIRIKDRLAFTTTSTYLVITNGRPLEVELVLEQVQARSLESQLMAGEWLLEDLGGAGVMDNLQTTLRFDGEERLGGSGGCNRYFASYKLKENQIKVGPIGATRKACLPAIMNQESRFFQALSQAYRIRLDGAFLFIDCRELDKPLKFTRRKFDKTR